MTVRTCSIPGCDRPHYARSWCLLHYRRWMRKGDPLAPIRGYGVAKHGTVGMYSNHKCRCPTCRAANAAKARAYANTPNGRAVRLRANRATRARQKAAA